MATDRPKISCLSVNVFRPFFQQWNLLSRRESFNKTGSSTTKQQHDKAKQNRMSEVNVGVGEARNATKCE
jgi:hypothetical protein